MKYNKTSDLKPELILKYDGQNGLMSDFVVVKDRVNDEYDCPYFIMRYDKWTDPNTNKVHYSWIDPYTSDVVVDEPYEWSYLK